MLVGQFTYATVAEPGPYSDASGWKVTEVVPNPEGLRTWVEKAAGPLGTFSPQTIPLLATEAEIRALPRRMRLDAADRQAALLNQVNAGRSNDHRDSSFTHGLLVQVQDGVGIDDLRPAQLWHSTAWLQPQDAAQVRAARLSADPDFAAGVPRSTPVEGDWANEKNLALLLLSILEGGWSGNSSAVSHVALVDPTGDRTARWADFLGRHVTVGAAWTNLGFSTHETALAGRAASLAGLRVIGLPEAESDGVRRSFGTSWVVLDPTQPVPAPAVPAGRTEPGWELGGGRWVPLGAWAQLAERLTLLDEMGLGSIAELLNRIEIDCAGSSDSRPLWALPAALLVAGEQVRELLSQVLPEAADLVRKHFPPNLTVPTATKDALLRALAVHSAAPVEAFADILRSADAGRGQADAAIEGYLTALWGVQTDGSAPAWVSDQGPLPWLPQDAAPSPELADRLLSGLPGRLAWSQALPDDPDRTVRILAGTQATGRLSSAAQVRMLACVYEVFARWELADRPPVATVVAPQLASVMLRTLQEGTPVAGDGWPVLRPAVFETVGRGLQDLLTAGWQLTAPVARWLDQQCGPLPTERESLERMSLLDLGRAGFAVRAAGGTSPTEVVRCATVLRDCLPPSPPQSVEWWLGALRFALGPQAGLEDVQWLLSVLAGRGVQLPAAGIAESLVRGQALDAQAARLAGWALGPAVPQGIESRFPGLATQLACRAELPATGEVGGDPRWARKLSALAEIVAQPDCRLRAWALPRLAADLLAVSAPLAVAGRWPWSRDPVQVLAGQWAAGFDLLDAASAGQQPRRLELARSLFVRALVAEQLSIRRRPSADPAGEFLIGRPDQGRDEWQVESLLHRLIDGVDRSDKQQWVADVRAEAVRACAAVPGAQPGLASEVQAMVEQNAAAIALGALGSRLPWGRVRSARTVPPDGEAWDTWNR